MTAQTGDIVRITPAAQAAIDSRGLSLQVGDEVEVVATLEDRSFAVILGAPEGAIWVEADNPLSDDGSFGLAPGEYELAA